MTLQPGFWLEKTLEEMNPEEWEALCDGCGLCCLHKLEDIDSGELIYTGIVCRHYDQETARCTCYPERHQRVPDCVVLTPQRVAELDWLPETCAYRLLHEGRPLPSWHPLRSGRRESVAEAGMAIAGKVVSEADVHPHDWAQAWLESRDETTSREDEETTRDD